MLNEFILVSGWLFWVLAGAGALILAWLLTEEDNFASGWAMMLATVFVVASVLFTDAFVGVRLQSLPFVAVGYVAVGALWSVKKWYSFVKRRYGDERENYEKNVNKSATGNETWEKWSQHRRPTAADNKQQILSWMILWPISVLWWLLTWPRQAFIWSYERLSTLFDRISEKIFAS